MIRGYRRPAGTTQSGFSMGAPVTFASKVAREHRPTLERLLFFNGCQERVARGIVEVIDRYGPPEIHADGEWLRVKVGGMPEVQSLFAIDTGTGEPIGVAVYVRADLEHIAVLHLGLGEEYCAGGERQSVNLLLRLIREIRRSSRRLKGVRRLRVLYGAQRSRAQA
jgi:hypothetical protein